MKFISEIGRDEQQVDSEVLRGLPRGLLTMKGRAIQDQSDRFSVIVQAAQPTEPLGQRARRLPP
jgi:hypothetical protein